MTTKGDITESIQTELFDRFSGSNTIEVIEFITRALGNFFSTDKLEEFYEFLKDE